MLKIATSMRVDSLPSRNEKRDAIDQQWISLLQSEGYQPVLIPNLVVNIAQYLDSLGIDGVLLTGGNDLSFLPEPIDSAKERDLVETQMIKYCEEKNLPLLGVCRGMQLISKYWGDEILPVNGHVSTSHCIEGNHPLFSIPKQSTVNSFHRFQVHLKPTSPLEIIARCPDGVVEAFIHSTLPQLGISWHPERSLGGKFSIQWINQLFRRQSCESSFSPQAVVSV